ncbi:LytTR family DNA-binding domain-containing protein [Sphingobium soli]|uniref:LytTR family DNA-binding domain-containing protein n=1 Tax=Sphingobium soli TaxID=1591116 RepID=A0ABS8H6P5_9SPHN|nr:LytTR family DNA-binding domain-containing protein [Sphingobium soli]MCC4234109.1 LytTR family DNA-binding domain-containing protein [Sphingobium soli]|tara:strand:- start:184 stop:888 length:705 start_codon:yes stop_codon:yes gene_type:complete
MADLSVLVVEDNLLASAALLRLMKNHDDIGQVVEVRSLAEARKIVTAMAFDVVFLDVCLPDGTGVALGSELVRRGHGPALVYLTADPTAAVDAFRQGAFDYLLKPIASSDLGRALRRVRQARHGAPPPPIEIRDGSSTRYIATELIAAVESAGHYQCIHAAGEVHLVRQPVAALLAQLGPGFVRVHRSVVVRTSLVTAMETRRNGDGELELAGGKRVRFSRSFRGELEKALGTR